MGRMACRRFREGRPDDAGFIPDDSALGWTGGGTHPYIALAQKKKRARPKPCPSIICVYLPNLRPQFGR
jgi:hypothetical protein